MLATILQVTFLSCTGMLTIMTSSLHIIKLKLKAHSVLRSKLVEKASPYIFLFIASQNGGAYTEVCGNMQKLPTGDVTCTSSTVSPYFFPIHLATAHMWKHSCNDIKRIHSINTQHITYLALLQRPYLRTKLGTEDSSLSLIQSNMQPAVPSPKHPRTYQNTFLQSLNSSFPGCR